MDTGMSKHWYVYIMGKAESHLHGSLTPPPGGPSVALPLRLHKSKEICSKLWTKAGEMGQSVKCLPEFETFEKHIPLRKALVKKSGMEVHFCNA